MRPVRAHETRLLDALAAATIASAVGACNGDVADPGAEAGPPPETVTLYPDAPPLPGETECKVVVSTGIQIAHASHVPVCTPVEYATNPPSGGDHWGIWAQFKRYEIPVPRPIYVHDLEHGAVALLTRCAAPCPEVTDALQAVMDAFPDDPTCLAVPGGPRARLLMSPDAELPTPIAAAAWGATYTATCIDPASLSSFAADAYGKATENLCSGGIAIDDPDAGAPDCGGAMP
jgi:hypothetical protein